MCVANGNKVATTKLLWNITQKEDFLWVKWIHTYYFRKGEVWQAKIPRNCSCNLKKILKHRDLVDTIGGWDKVLKNGKLNIKTMYTLLRPTPGVVWWKRIVCNSLASPKSVFIA